LLNLDDSAIKYEEMFDPDIKEFYGMNAIPPQIWEPQVLIQKELLQCYLQDHTAMTPNAPYFVMKIPILIF
jgi:hypothetical protein